MNKRQFVLGMQNSILSLGIFQFFNQTENAMQNFDAIQTLLKNIDESNQTQTYVFSYSFSQNNGTVFVAIPKPFQWIAGELPSSTENNFMIQKIQTQVLYPFSFIMPKTIFKDFIIFFS